MSNDHEAPDRDSAGNVGTTGHSDHDVDSGGHGGHGDDEAAEVSTLVPTTWKQLILPLLILLLVIILLWGPVSSAFSPAPPAPPGNEQQVTGGEHSSIQPSPAAALSTPTEVAMLIEPTSTSPPPTATAPSPPSPTTDTQLAQAIATQTAVALLGQQGVASRAPVKLVFGTAEFAVEPGSGLLPDWKPPAGEGRAVWIQGTYANHIIYLPYSDSNAALFTAARTGDLVKLVMDTGQTFEFAVTRAQRAVNGPPTSGEEFTVTTAMGQDHAGVTLFLVGDPAPDRAVIQADFTGNIQ